MFVLVDSPGLARPKLPTSYDVIPTPEAARQERRQNNGSEE
jgi:hypothetical protein